MKKLIILLCILFLFSGCTIDYDITFKYDNKIDENIKFTIPNKTIEDSGYTVKESVESALHSYSDILNSNSFKSSVEYNTNNVVVTLKSKNKSVEKFISFLYFRMMFNGADIEDTDEYYSFKTNGIYNQSGLFYDLSGIADDGFVDQININIKFENEIISCNADKFNEETNTGTWVLVKDTENKVIEFKIKKSSQTNNHSKDKNDKKSSFNILYVFIGIGALIGIIILILLYAVGLNKKRNKL